MTKSKAVFWGVFGLVFSVFGGAMSFADLVSAPIRRPGFGAGGLAQLSLDGINSGIVKITQNGSIGAQVVTTPTAMGISRKQLGAPLYGEIAMDASLSMGQPLLDWVAAGWSLNPRGSAKNGALSPCNSTNQEFGQTEFLNAVVVETTFPDLDAQSKDAGELRVQFAPEAIRYSKVTAKCSNDIPPGQKKWLASNFRLELDRVDTSGVSKIDSFTVKTRSSGNTYNSPRETVFPDLRVTVMESRAQGFLKWAQEFIIEGNNSDSKEKTGAIVFLDPSLKNELGRVRLFGVGISKFEPVPSNGTDGAPKVAVELYVERMEFEQK